MHPQRKIIFCTREGAGQAGGEVRSLALAVELCHRGLDVEVISFMDYHIKIPEMQLTLFKKLVINGKIFLKLLKKRPQVIVIQRVNYHVGAPLIYWGIFRPQLILDIDDWEIREKLKATGSFRRGSFAFWLTSRIAGWANHTVVSSRFLRLILKPYARSLSQIPSGIAWKNYFIERYAVRPQKVVWCGSLDREDTQFEILNFVKGFTTFASKQLKLLLIARGRGVSRLQEYLGHIKDSRIQLVPNLPSSHVPGWLKECHIGILPLIKRSKFNRAKSPVKLFEYMAAGLIPVVTPVGEARLILGQAGYKAESLMEMFAVLNRVAHADLQIHNQWIQVNQNKIRQEYSLAAVGQRWHDVLVSA